MADRKVFVKCKECVHRDPETGDCLYGGYREPIADPEFSCTAGKTKEMLEAARSRVDKNPGGWEEA